MLICILAVLLAFAAAFGAFEYSQKKAAEAAAIAAAEKQAELEEALRLAEAEAEKAAEEARLAAQSEEKAKKEAEAKAQSQGGPKTIYLTFDDGPCIYTPDLLEVLDEYGVKVTFFVTYNHPSCMKYMAQAAKAGHSIGVHTYSHVYSSIYTSTDAYWEDFEKMQNVIYENTGIETKIFRFPGGASNLVSKKYCEGIMTDLVAQSKERGLCYFDWNIDSGDTIAANTAEDIANIIETNIEKVKNPVVLQHDIKPKSIEAVRMVIEWALDKGYKFDVLCESSPVCHNNVLN